MPDVISQITSHPRWAEVDGKERRLILRDALAKQPQWAEVDPHEQEKITHEVWDKYAPESPVTSTATAQIGKTPYKWGGEDLNKGADCSGFTCRVYEKAGKKLPRTAREQYKVGTPVQSLADLQPGDQIFFKGTQKDLGPDDASHTGIYLGDGRFVHASSAKGNVVEDDLSKPYWKKKWLGAKRHVTTPGGNMPIVNGAVEEAMTAVRQKAASKTALASNIERLAAEQGITPEQARKFGTDKAIRRAKGEGVGQFEGLPADYKTPVGGDPYGIDRQLASKVGLDAQIKTFRDKLPMVGKGSSFILDALAGQEGTMDQLVQDKSPLGMVASTLAGGLDPTQYIAGGALGGIVGGVAKSAGVPVKLAHLGMAAAFGAPAVAGGIHEAREGNIAGGATEAALGIGALLLPGLIGKRQAKAMNSKLDALQNGESLSLTKAGADKIVSVLDPKKLRAEGLEVVRVDEGKGKTRVEIRSIAEPAPDNSVPYTNKMRWEAGQGKWVEEPRLTVDPPVKVTDRRSRPAPSKATIDPVTGELIVPGGIKPQPEKGVINAPEPTDAVGGIVVPRGVVGTTKKAPVTFEQKTGIAVKDRRGDRTKPVSPPVEVIRQGSTPSDLGQNFPVVENYAPPRTPKIVVPKGVISGKKSVAPVAEPVAEPVVTPEPVVTNPVAEPGAAPAPASEPTGVTTGTKLHKPDTDTYQTVLKVEDGVAHVKASTGTVVKMPAAQLNALVDKGKYNVVPAKGAKPVKPPVPTVDEALAALPKDANIGLDPRPYINVVRSWVHHNVKPVLGRLGASIKTHWENFKEWSRNNSFLNPDIHEERLRKWFDAEIAAGKINPLPPTPVEWKADAATESARTSALTKTGARTTTPMPIVPKGVTQDEEAIPGQVPQGQAKQNADAATSPIKEGNAQAKPVQEVNAPVGDVVSIAKAVTGRDALGTKDLDTILEGGRNALATGKHSPESLVSKAATGEAFNDSEMGALLQTIANKASHVKSLLGDLADNAEPNARKETASALKAAEAEYETLKMAGDQAANTWHKSGKALQIALKDNTIVDLPMKAKAYTGGDDALAPSGMHEKIREFQVANERLEKEIEALRAKVKSDVEGLAKKPRSGSYESSISRFNALMNKKESDVSVTMSRQQGAVRYSIPKEEVLARKLLRNAASHLASNGMKYDAIIETLQKDTGKTRAQLEEFLSEPLHSKLIASDVNRLKAQQYIQYVEQTANYKRKSNLNKVASAIGEAVTVAWRSLEAAVDISAPFTQGKTTLLTKPSVWLKAWKPMMLAAKNPEYALEHMARIQRSPLYARAKAGKLGLSEYGGAPSASEEMFVGHLIDKLGEWAKTKGPVGKTVEQLLSIYPRSEAMYTTFLNDIRWNTFKSYMTPELARDPQYIREISGMINSFTGKGASQLANVVGGSQAAGKILFAPRYTISQWETAFLRPLWSAKSPEARRVAAGNYLKMAGATAAILGLAKISLEKSGKGSVETDPRSTNFGKLYANGQWIDVGFGKLFQPLRFVTQMVAGRISSTGKYKDASESAADTAWRYGTNKAAPVPRILMELLYGKVDKTEGGQFRHRKLEGNDVAWSLAPIWIQQVTEEKNWKSPGNIAAAILGMDTNKSERNMPTVPFQVGDPKYSRILPQR